MKKFLKQACVFLIPLIILGVTFEVALRQIPNDYDFKYSQIDLEKEFVKILILGSSHSMYGFNPDFFKEKAYNLGHVSQTIDLDYYLLEKYIKVLPKLETVIVRLSYTTMHEQIKTGPESWRLKDYNLYYNLNVSNNLKYKSEGLSVKLKNNLSRLKNYYLDQDKMIQVETSGWAFFKEERTINSIKQSGTIIAKRHTIKDDALVDENIEFLDKIMKLCKNEGVKVLLVTLPAHKSYRANLDKHQLNIVVSAGERMKQKYNNCSYLNLLEDDNFNGEDFYDADHLNRKGAKKLSVLVDRFISAL
jgi:hypothetical protein